MTPSIWNGRAGMSFRFAPIVGLLLFSGCAYHVAEQTDHLISDIAKKSFDREPTETKPPAHRPSDPPKEKTQLPQSNKDIQTARYLDGATPEGREPAPALQVPEGIPGSEVPRLVPFKDKEEMQRDLKRLYPPLPPLPEEPKPLPRADGKPYTLSELQELAALNNPALRQSASDVKAAEGTLIQARTYANPTVAYGFQPSNDGETAGVHGVLFDQKINTAGKMKLRIAAAQKDYDNAELALKRARSDLATQVRSAYFGVLVSKETVRINRALSILTDEIYRAQAELLQKGGFAASYEPSSLRAQAYSARLALQQSITSYLYNWKQLVAVIGLHQIPLSEVSGRIDAFIPYFDYDAVLNHALLNHTDILSARNSIERSRYNLKLARITPVSDVDFQFYVGKETSLQPFQWYAQGQVGFTLPVWDRNKGNIINAEAGLVRAAEQPRVAELNLTNNLQNAYGTYKNNLDALEYYRRHILPDQVRAYRGVLERRQVDPNAQFGDLVQSQQALAANVSTYLSILAQLWTASVTIADFLQTDDMFQLANPKAIPALPQLDKLPFCPPAKIPTQPAETRTLTIAPLDGPRLPPGALPPPLMEVKP